MAECRAGKNKAACNCTYEPCPRKGVCCDCVAYHLRMRELPGCVFDPRGERSYDRSFEHFARLVNEGRI